MESDNNDTDADYVPDKEETQNAVFKSIKRRNHSKGWKYFEDKDPKNKIACCKLCKKDISYNYISNLIKHTLRKHGTVECKAAIGNLDIEDTDGDTLNPGQRKSSGKRKMRQRSVIWKYFVVQDDVAKMARCKMCHQVLAYKNSSNLKKHLLRKHTVVKPNPPTDDVAEADADEPEIETASPVWAYYKCLDESLQIASCLICKKRIDYNYELDLKSHLNRKHPQIDFDGLTNRQTKLMITGNGDIFEVDNRTVKEAPESHDEDSSWDWTNHNNEINALHSTEFVDECAFDNHESRHAKRKRPQPPCQPEVTTEESSLDIFGRYMASLLKELPKEKSDQLQVEFVKRIMEAHSTDGQNDSYGNNESQMENGRCGNNEDSRVTSNSETQRAVTSD